jgi:hydroxylaminobenzene mutase
MGESNKGSWYDLRLIQLGFFLFLIGLLTGFAIPIFVNPRMGLASHLQGILNGMFLILLGIIWPKLKLKVFWMSFTFWAAIYATFANWLATLLAAIWGAGLSMPIAALGNQGTFLQELTIDFLLISLSIAIIIVCINAIIGLKRTKAD